MLKPISLVISLLIAGDVLVASTGLPAPGAVLAMLALAVICSVCPETGAGVARLFDAVARVAPMLFVPAAVGIIARLDAIASAWLAIVSAVTLSTAAALLVTGWSFQALLQLRRRLTGAGSWL